MKKAFILFLPLILLAKIDISSFESNFTQIVKEDSKKIKYFGKLYFKKPMKVLWKYEKPIKKDIYIVNDQVIIIEPEIEQVTISHFSETKNIIDILNNAKKIGDKKYKATYNEQDFYIFLDEKNRLKKIEFKDKLDNEVEILFESPKQNTEIDDEVFRYKIDPEFDIIFQ